MNIPYGMGDFGMVRRGSYFYVDKTHFIPRLEDPQRGRRNLMFLRPRRFGKTLFLSTLQSYYDLLRAAEFDELFAGLYIAQHPTPERNSYLILRLDFAGLATDRDVEALRASFTRQVRDAISGFFTRYQHLLPEQAAAWQATLQDSPEPADHMFAFLSLVQNSPHQVYLLIDEHDNFANDLIAQGREHVYHNVVKAAGFVREFYKRIKTGADNGIIARLFMTGVTPVMVNDMTSGFNVAKSISTNKDFHDLCGFRGSDVEHLLDRVIADQGLSLSREEVLFDLRRYYDGYRFSPGCERLYNPNMVLYFMTELSPPDCYPTELVDLNIRTDQGRLRRLLFTSDNKPRPGPIEWVRALLSEGSMVAHLYDLFQLDDAYNEQYFTSYLYYLGLLTIEAEVEGQLRLRIPNVVIDQTYGAALNAVLQAAAEVTVEDGALRASIRDMAYRGQIGPFLTLVYSQVIRKLSNRDLIRMDERALKMLLLAYLSLDDLFFPFTELEVGRGYADMVLMLNRRYHDARYTYLIELKYIKETAAPAPQAKKTTARTRKTATVLKREVEACFVEAEEQLRRYLSEPRLCSVEGPSGWKAVSIVQVGTDRLFFRELGQPTQEAALTLTR